MDKIILQTARKIMFFFLTSVIFPKLKMKGGAKNNVFKVFHNVVHKAAYKRAYKSLRW